MSFTLQEQKQLNSMRYFGPGTEILATYISLVLNRKVTQEEVNEWLSQLSK